MTFYNIMDNSFINEMKKNEISETNTNSNENSIEKEETGEGEDSTDSEDLSEFSDSTNSSKEFIFTESEPDSDDNHKNEYLQENIWFKVDGSHLKTDVKFFGTPCYNKHVGDYPNNISNLTPLQVYREFLDNEILNLIVNEINNLGDNTNENEIEKFIAIVLIKGLNESHSSFLGSFKKIEILLDKIPEIMSKHRFNTILNNFNFGGKRRARDRLYKINKLYELMERKFKKNYVPGETLIVKDVTFTFENHHHKFKLCKLCDSKGYTYRFFLSNFEPFVRGQQQVNQALILELVVPYLNEGRTLIVDDHTSIPLAKKLIQSKTHLLGRISKNWKDLPPKVINCKLKKGQVIGKENANGYVVGKWLNKKQTIFLTTQYGLETEASKSGKQTPIAILKYKNEKHGLQLYDKSQNIFKSMRTNMRWYHAPVFDLLFNVALFNAWIVLKELKEDNISYREFREDLLLELTSNMQDKKQT